MLPDDWLQTRLGQHFQSSRVKGRDNLPTLSVTIHDGLVRRDSLDRKMETNLAENEHLLVREGDIAYNMMRMWQGASGLAPYDAIVSPAYVVLRANDTIDPRFAAYLFKFPRMIYLFWAYSYGITEDRLRLYFNDFSAIPVRLPPRAEQQRITEILLTWDQAIEKVEQLIANTHDQKKALMQQFLSGKKRLRGFQDTWTPTALGDLGSFRKGKGISRGDAVSEGIPCIRYGEIYTHHHDVIREFVSFISQETAQDSERITCGDILFTCSGETAEEIGKCVAYLDDGEAFAGGDIIIFSSENDDPVFLAYLLNSHPLATQKAQFGQGNSVVHISAANLAKLKFMRPSLEEQRAIGGLLLAADDEIRTLETQRSLLAREKDALMQQLLTGKRRVKLGRKEAA